MNYGFMLHGLAGWVLGLMSMLFYISVEDMGLDDPSLGRRIEQRTLFLCLFRESCLLLSHNQVYTSFFAPPLFAGLWWAFLLCIAARDHYLLFPYVLYLGIYKCKGLAEIQPYTLVYMCQACTQYRTRRFGTFTWQYAHMPYATCIERPKSPEALAYKYEYINTDYITPLS